MLSKNQIKQVKALHLKKFRDEEKLFIAEGIKIVSEIIAASPQTIRHLFLTKNFVEENSRELIRSKAEYTVITEEELKKISTQSQPNNALAVCHYFKDEKPKTDLNKQFTLYLDDIRDPGNLGTIVRMADWFGLKEIFCSEQTTDIYNPKAIQSAMGSFLRVRIHYCDLDEVLNKSKINVYGAVLNGKNIYESKLQNGLIIIGNEANGISQINLQKITQPITIPSATNSTTESLNAAMATGIIVAEFFRQSQNP